MDYISKLKNIINSKPVFEDEDNISLMEETDAKSYWGLSDYNFSRPSSHSITNGMQSLRFKQNEHINKEILQKRKKDIFPTSQFIQNQNKRVKGPPKNKSKLNLNSKKLNHTNNQRTPKSSLELTNDFIELLKNKLKRTLFPIAEKEANFEINTNESIYENLSMIAKNADQRLIPLKNIRYYLSKNSHLAQNIECKLNLTKKECQFVEKSNDCSSKYEKFAFFTRYLMCKYHQNFEAIINLLIKENGNMKNVSNLLENDNNLSYNQKEKE